MRFSFEDGADERNPKLAVHDSPPEAPRAWHGPLTAAQRRQFAEIGLTLVPSVLSVTERRAPVRPDVLTQRLQAPLQSCQESVKEITPASDVACEVWLARNGDATFQIAQESLAVKEGDGLIVNADVYDDVQHSGAGSLQELLAQAGLEHAQQTPQSRL